MAEEPSYPTNVVVFKSDSPRTITPKFTQSGVTLQYSIDNGSTWNNISSGGTTASSDEIWFRGRATGTKSLYTPPYISSSYAWVFSGDASNKLHVYGDLRYLLCDNLGDNTITFNIASYCFSYMFYGCTSLTTAPSLPSTTLSLSCYEGMFRGCTSLTTAPSLPATTLADWCYYEMFYGCTGLTTAPELPATTLATSCYNRMFKSCTSLTTAPSLPATTLADYCYASMFNGCTSLTTAPSLPATTLADWCYYEMFYGCTGLTTAPELPATTLATSCYNRMFKSCTSLTTAPSLPATTLATTCYTRMFESCTGLTTAPELPATTLTDSCYYEMFRGCTGLTTAPELPATTLADYCYYSMFYDCTSLKISANQIGDYQYAWRIPTSGEGTTATGWNTDMLLNTGGTFKGEPSINTTYYVENPPVSGLSGFNITFEENGGTTQTDLTEQTLLPDPLPTPTKPGYTFVAWYYESNFQTRAKAGDTIESNVTLYAKWHNLGSLFTEIANAIRSKDGTSETIRDVDFGERVKQIQGAKEEQTKTVSPTTSSQDVLPDANKVLSKVTVNAIPTETKSQQPNLSSGNQTINATSGKFMTSFTITKDTINHIASNIRSGITLYGVTGNLQPAKEEETKTVTPNFSSGNQVITPTSGKVLSQVTLTKPTDLLPENIAKDKNVCGVVGTLEGGAEMPSTAGGSIFTGATIPLTYKNNTHDYENNYEYKSATHNITITGLEGRATITGNGTKNVLVAFDVTSSTTSLKNFTITCVNEEQELTYKGLHAHYGETVTGILTFAYNNITHDGSEGTFNTSGLTANYKFIVTSSSDLPIFSENTTLWNTIYSHQLLNVLIGNFSGTSIGSSFMRYCYAFNQVLTLPSGVSSIGNYFMSVCSAFNQPLTLPSGVSSIGSSFMRYCYAFNQPLTLPSGLSSIGNSFMSDCYAFNQPLTLPSGVSSIGNYFMSVCSAFNQPLTLPSGVSSIGDYFMSSCRAFNQPLTLPSGLSSIGDYFMSSCRAFNQVLTLPSGVSSIGDYFMSDCYALSTIIWNASVYPTDNGSLSQDIDTKTNSTYGAGIKVYGTKRTGLISALPDRTSSPFRKLINGGS